MRGFLNEFANPVRDLADNLVAAAVDVYERIAEDLLPTPAKSHYVFNLRDLSKCVQGVLQADSGVIRDAQQMQRYLICIRGILILSLFPFSIPRLDYFIMNA